MVLNCGLFHELLPVGRQGSPFSQSGWVRTLSPPTPSFLVPPTPKLSASFLFYLLDFCLILNLKERCQLKNFLNHWIKLLLRMLPVLRVKVTEVFQFVGIHRIFRKRYLRYSFPFLYKIPLRNDFMVVQFSKLN